MDVPLDELEVPSSLARRKNHPNQLLAPLSGETPAPEDNLGEGLLQANDRRRWRVLSQTSDEYLSPFTPRAAYPNQLTPVEVSLAAGDDFDSDRLQPSVYRRISSPLDEGNFSFTRSGDYPNRLTVSEESIVLEDDPDTDQLESNAGGKPAPWHSTNTPDSPLLGGTDERLHQSRLFEVRSRGPAVNLLRLLFLLITVLSYWFYLLLCLGLMKRRVENFMNNMDLRICGPKPSKLSAGTQSDCTIQPNPDIAGIGGRVALYAQSVLLGFLLVFSPKLDAASPARWALGVSALAFLASAIISSITNQITLYHLEVATQMQEIPLVILTTAEFVSPRSRGPYILILYLIRGLMYAAVVYWGGIQGPCFGTQSECNGTMLVNNGLILWFSRSTRIIDPQHRFRGMFFTTIMVWYVLANILFDPETYLLAAQSLISSKSRHKWIKLPPVWYFALNWRIRIRPLGVDLYSTPPNRLPEGHPWSSISDVDGSLTPAITDAGYSELGFGRRPSPHRFLGFYIFPIPLSQRTRHPWLRPLGIATHPNPPKEKPRTWLTDNRPPALKPFTSYQNTDIQRGVFRWAQENAIILLKNPKFDRALVGYTWAGIRIHSLEKTLTLNNVAPGENAWTYGQILAVLLTMIPLVQVLQLFRIVPRTAEYSDDEDAWDGD